MTPQDIFLKYKQIIINAIHSGIIIEHVGGSVIKGAIQGKGDVDIQIRVASDEFGSATESLKEIFTVKRPELWNEDVSVFKATEGDTPIDIVITRIGGDYDYFHLIRDAIELNPDLLSEYNNIKIQHNPQNIEYLSDAYLEYSKAKQKLYKKIFKEKFNKVFS